MPGGCFEFGNFPNVRSHHTTAEVDAIGCQLFHHRSDVSSKKHRSYPTCVDWIHSGRRIYSAEVIDNGTPMDVMCRDQHPPSVIFGDAFFLGRASRIATVNLFDVSQPQSS